MTIRTRLSAALCSFALPILCVAAAPGPVTNLSGEAMPDGKVVVRWDPLPGADIVLYRLYYSADSILESEGLYDDFEETNGAVTEFTFTDPPKQSFLFITVLGVNSVGEESDSFMEEIRIDLAAQAPAPTPTPKPVQPVASSAAAASSSSLGFVAPVIDIKLPTLEELGVFGQNGVTPTPTPVALPPVASRASSSSLAPAPLAVSSSSIAPAASRASVAPPVLTLPPTPTVTNVNPSVPMLTAPPSDGYVHLLSAEALSPTQVKLTFSAEVMIDEASAPGALRIEGLGGNLHITQLRISDKIMVLETAPQQRGSTYRVILSEPLQSTAGEPLHATDRSATFAGHELGDAPQAPPAVYNPAFAKDVMGFRLQATPETGGKTYTVLAQWDPDLSRGDIAYYVVRQTLDGGLTYSDPEPVPMDIGGIEIKGAQPGSLGISLNVVNVYGAVSTGVFSTVTLPGNVPVGAPTAPPVPPMPLPVPALPPLTSMVQGSIPHMVQGHSIIARKDNLSKTGIGLFAAGSSCIGALIGWKRSKRSRA